MVAIPLNKPILARLGIGAKALCNPGLTLWRPYLYRPGEEAEMVVHPVVPYPRDHLIGVIAKVVIDAYVRVAGKFSPLLAYCLKDPKVFRRHRIVGLCAVRAQQHPSIGMAGESAGDAWMARDKLQQIVHFRLAAGEGAGAALLMLLAPMGRKVPIKVKPLLIALQR